MPIQWWTVRLIRGEKPDVVHSHTDGKAARERANRISELHGSKRVETRGHEFVIDATNWYKRG